MEWNPYEDMWLHCRRTKKLDIWSIALLHKHTFIQNETWKKIENNQRILDRIHFELVFVWMWMCVWEQVLCILAMFWLDFNDESIINTCGVIGNYVFWCSWAKFLNAFAQWYICSLTAFTRSHASECKAALDSTHGCGFSTRTFALIWRHRSIIPFSLSLSTPGHSNKCDQWNCLNPSCKWNRRQFTKWNIVFYETYTLTCTIPQISKMLWISPLISCMLLPKCFSFQTIRFEIHFGCFECWGYYTLLNGRLPEKRTKIQQNW